MSRLPLSTCTPKTKRATPVTAHIIATLRGGCSGYTTESYNHFSSTKSTHHEQRFRVVRKWRSRKQKYSNARFRCCNQRRTRMSARTKRRSCPHFTRSSFWLSPKNPAQNPLKIPRLKSPLKAPQKKSKMHGKKGSILCGVIRRNMAQ